MTVVDQVRVAIVGAGPYGLSVAAHLKQLGVEFRIFGSAMQTWREHMPDGMLLKSDGFASDIYDPRSAFTLKQYCASSGIAYHDTMLPVSLETFRAYGLAFQQKMVPELEDRLVVALTRDDNGYLLRFDDGGTCRAKSVILAIGIGCFQNVPPELVHLPQDVVSHSYAHRDLTRYKGRRVTVMGAGASAIDVAVLLREAGADVTLVTRRARLRFADPPESDDRPVWQRLRHPASPIGPGWRSRIFSDMPWAIHAIPQSIRRRIIGRHLGPAAGWPMRKRFDGITTLLSHHLEAAEVSRGGLSLAFESPEGRRQHQTEHVIAATGYKVDVRRIAPISADVLREIQTIDNAPVLSPSFESTARGLYFVGPASMSSFGPVMRFACGAKWSARRIVARFVRDGARRLPMIVSRPPVAEHMRD